MEKILIQPMTTQNWLEAVKISVCEDQKNFGPSVFQSLSYAYNKPWDEALDPFVLSIENKIIGFFNVSYTPHSIER
jgi:diamine N-acetyltransferase